MTSKRADDSFANLNNDRQDRQISKQAFSRQDDRQDDDFYSLDDRFAS